MYRKMRWSDRIGILIALCFIPAMIFLWLIGWLAMYVLIVATLICFLFCFLVFFIVAREDDDPNNDAPTEVIAVMSADARSQWDAVINRVEKPTDG